MNTHRKNVVAHYGRELTSPAFRKWAYPVVAALIALFTALGFIEQGIADRLDALAIAVLAIPALGLARVNVPHRVEEIEEPDGSGESVEFDTDERDDSVE